nr:MAG TPA: hypothetical protein [Caudoviricetes sp.]
MNGRLYNMNKLNRNTLDMEEFKKRRYSYQL